MNSVYNIRYNELSLLRSFVIEDVTDIISLINIVCKVERSQGGKQIRAPRSGGRPRT